MDVVWFILDSLNFEGTSFASDGPDTTPELERLARSRGTIFTEAYAPGPSSPSSHSSFFTGKLPSETGMYESSPYFDGRVPTIAEAMRSTHRTSLVSVNPFLFNGLERGFEDTDDLAAEQYTVFESGRDPRQFAKTRDVDSSLHRIAQFVWGDRPVRSLVNGISYKFWRWRGNSFIPKAVDETSYQYAGRISDKIRDAVTQTQEDSFVVANFMDIHHPYDAADETLAEFTPAGVNPEDLPIGVRKDYVDDFDQELMDALYRASVKDTDRKIAPLVEDLLDRDAMVIITSDHGPALGWDYLSDRQLHVPLLIFSPNHRSTTVDSTVSIRSLPRTTEAVVGADTTFDGVNLFEMSEDQVAITEHIHSPADNRADPVAPTGIDGSTVRYHAAAVEGGTKVTFRNGDTKTVRGERQRADGLQAVLRRAHENYAGSDHSVDIEYDAETERRLENLGYL